MRFIFTPLHNIPHQWELRSGLNRYYPRVISLRCKIRWRGGGDKAWASDKDGLIVRRRVRTSVGGGGEVTRADGNRS